MSSNPAQKSKLGRGLASLLGKQDGVSQTHEYSQILLSELTVSIFQPRKAFDTAHLSDLAASIKKNGVIQPILVRPNPKKHGHYEIIAGERRFRASALAGLTKIPAHILKLNDQEARIAALVENLQRADLNAVEEAHGFQAALSSKVSQDDLAALIGKSRSHVANTLRLLKLPEAVLDKLASNEISAGHARALLSLDDPIEGLKAILMGGLNVRQTEALSQNKKTTKPANKVLPEAVSKFRDQLSQRVGKHGLAVKVDATSKGRGSMKISWANAKQFAELQEILKNH